MDSILEEKDRIRELLSSYCWHYDAGEFDQWLALWADGASFDLDGDVMRGLPRLQKFAADKRAAWAIRKPAMKHYVLNDIIKVEGDGAVSKCSLLVMRQNSDGSIFAGAAGSFEDKLVKKDGRWLFAERVLRRALRNEP